MTNLKQTADFTGKTIYVGMDVHLKSWNITLYHEQQYLRKFQQEANPQALINHLTQHFPGAQFTLAYEAGFCGFWIQRAFADAGMNCIVVNAADVPQTDKGSKMKNDTNDSKRISESLSGGMLRGIHIPDSRTEGDRTIVRYRHRLQNDLIRCKIRIKSLLHQMGVKIPAQFDNSKWTLSLMKWLKELQFQFPSIRLTLSRMIENVEYLQKQMLQLSRDLREMIRSEYYNQNAKLLLSVPGIGALTAISFLTEIGSIKRFKTFYHFNSFIGLCPTEFSSGPTERIGSITPRHHNLLRKLIVEMAWTTIRLDPAIMLAYNEYKKRMTPKRAIIRIARKMLHRIYYLLTQQKVYEKGIVK